MATKVYGTSVIPSDTVEVRSGGTVSISLGFNASVLLIGNMDVANGSANVAEVESVDNETEAENLFGTGSELHYQTRLAYANNVSEVYAAAVEEVNHVETFSAANGTLANVPVIDPNVANEHDIIVEEDTTADGAYDTALTVNIVYGTPSAPSESDTVEVNPITGEWVADASGDYQFTYDEPDFSTAISEAAKKNVRFVVALTESEGVANTLLSELNNRAQDFDFKRGIAGADPEAVASDYADTMDDQRMVLVAPPRAFLDENSSQMVRTMGAIGGKQAGSPLGDSTTYEPVNGFVTLNTKYSTTELGTLIDKQLLPIMEAENHKVVKDMTTSTDTKFERIFACEIADEAAELSHLISEQFIGELNTEENRAELRESHEVAYGDMKDDVPPQLDDYSVHVSEGASENEVDVEVGLDIVNVMDYINVTISVGDVLTYEGAT